MCRAWCMPSMYFQAQSQTGRFPVRGERDKGCTGALSPCASTLSNVSQCCGYSLTVQKSANLHSHFERTALPCVSQSLPLSIDMCVHTVLAHMASYLHSGERC